MTTIYFDMDGTIVDLYSVYNWVSKLNMEDSSPYDVSGTLVDIKKFENLLIKLKEKGYKIGIISWGSKKSGEKFLEETREVKKKWIEKNLPNVKFDEFVVLDYSCNKASAVEDPFGILFDDSNSIRISWPGKAYQPKDMFKILNDLLKEGDSNERN